MPLLGAHMSIAGGLFKAVDAAARCGMDCVQIFSGSPQIWSVTTAPSADKSPAKKAGVGTKTSPQWHSKPIADDEVQRFERALSERHISHPISHSSYLINLASPGEELWEKSVAAMLVELQRADQLAIPFVVMHPGSHTTASEAEGLANIVRAIDEIHARGPTVRAQILLENTAGQGSNLGWRFEHLATILEQLKTPQRVGVCFDTCHAFAAGYPLDSAQEFRDTFREFDDVIGVERIRAFHLNDSKRELGSRVDRHEHIGVGQLGVNAFRHLLNDERFQHVPMYLETPKGEHDGEDWDVTNLRVLRDLTA